MNKATFFALSRSLSLALPMLAAAGAAADSPEKPAPLSHDEIKSVVDSHIGDVKSCAKEHGAATGKLVVEFGILPNGKVIDNKPKQHSSNAALDNCIAKKFAEFTFPKPHGLGNKIMGVDYPFVFSVPPPPKVGTLAPDQVLATIKAKQPEVDGCYQAAVKEKADLKGLCRLALVVSKDGKVTEAKVLNSTTGSAKLDACLVDKVKNWPFPKPAGDGDASFAIPFDFSPPAKKE